jgi:hypothetical protein
MQPAKLACAVTLLLVAVQTGCHSIQSSAVRDLVKREGIKIDAAQTNIHQYHHDTQKRIGYLKQSLDDLDASIKLIQAAEARHALIAASPQNVLTKKAVDAWAVSYLIGKTYLTEYQGLEQAVKKQFEDDFCAVLEAASKVEDSWGDIAKIHTQIERYSRQSFLASVDPEFVAALVEQVPGGSDRLAQALVASRTVNEALGEAATYRFLKSRALDRTRSLTVDLMELVDRVK